MKRLISMLVISLFALGIVAAQPKQKATTKATDVKLETTVIQVPTMVCNSCASTITKAVKKVVGVKTAKVDVKKKTATVSFASMKTNLSQIEKAIADAGYDANDTKRNPEAFEKLDACCKVDGKK
jgi:periplasmic mercuric ion binding protein